MLMMYNILTILKIYIIFFPFYVSKCPTFVLVTTQIFILFVLVFEWIIWWTNLISGLSWISS